MIVVNDVWMCISHHTARYRAALRTARNQLEEELRQDWNNGLDVDVILAKINIAYDEHRIAGNAFNALHRLVGRWLRVELQMNFAAIVNPGPPRTLAQIATNKQSVHTAAVSEQTNRAMEVLLAQTVPVTLIVPSHLEFEEKAVEADVGKWYAMKTCRELNDCLYQKALDGLWVLIQAHKEKDELVKRLLEEMKESVGMCCEGHISRLCNVLVGFDDRFSPPVPVGELLQQRIAAIAAQEVSVEQKVCLAWAVFEELKIPMEERDPWIEAF